MAQLSLLLIIVLSEHPDRPEKHAVDMCCQTYLSHNKATNLNLTYEKRDKKMHGLDHSDTHQRGLFHANRRKILDDLMVALSS